MSASARPVFIVGAPRSGTTLLQYMLRAHPSLSLPTGESHFFVPLLRNLDQFGDLNTLQAKRAVLEAMYRQSANFLDTDLHGIRFEIPSLAEKLQIDGCHTMPTIIARLFELNAEGEGKVRWGDKTPYYVFHMQLLQQFYPNAQFIHLIRDGRDVALSLFARRDDFRVYNAYVAGKYWVQYVDSGREQGRILGPLRYLEVKYEDLISNPKIALQKICGFLCEEYSDSLLDYQRAQEAGKTPLVSQPLQATNTDKWRESMSARQIARFEAAAHETLIANGYKLATNGKPLSILERIAFRLHNKTLSTWRKGRG